MAKSSTQTFYGTKNTRGDQAHKTRRQIVKEFVKEWTGKGIIKEDVNHLLMTYCDVFSVLDKQLNIFNMRMTFKFKRLLAQSQ